MMARYVRVGQIESIQLRPERLAAVQSVKTAQLELDGLKGDHSKAGKRAVTLIQAEHLPVIAKLADLESLDPALLRRNIVVSRLNLLGFRKSRLRIGQSVLEVAGPCPPCSRMEKALGHGGYTAMRGHSGVYAEVIAPGKIEVGDLVEPV